MKSIISSAVIALLAISSAAQTNTTNTTVPVIPVNTTGNGTDVITPVVDNTTTVINGTDNNGTGAADNGTAVDNGTAPVDNGTAPVDNSTGATNGTDNGTIVDNNGTSTDNGTGTVPGNDNTGTGSGNNVVVIDPNALVPCQSTNQTQCAFVFGTEFCCINAGGNLISDNSVFNRQFCYNQTLLNEQRSSSIEYGNDVNLNSFACLGGSLIQLTGAAVIVGAATLLF